MRRDAQRMKRHVDELVRRCRAAGMSVTPQRFAIYEALLMSTDHPSPEVLYRRARRKMSSLSLATIYKALGALKELGLVSEVPGVAESRRYDANSDRHHHLVCQRCRRITDLYDDAFDALRPQGGLDGFVPHSVSVQVIGLCADCSKQPPQ